jgi:hypothetical protein
MPFDCIRMYRPCTLRPTPPSLPNSTPSPGGVSGQRACPHAQLGIYRRRLTGRLWNTTSCLTVAPLTHAQVAPGLDVERDIIAHMEFRPFFPDEGPKLMDARIFT